MTAALHSTTPRIYRRESDSSTLTRPRVFARTFAVMAELARTVGFYEALAKTPLDQDIDIPDAGLHVVAVGPFLILVLDRSKLGEERYHQATQMHVTILNADVECAVAKVIAAGATMARSRFEVPHGSGYRIRHPDGLLVQYLPHRPSEYDVDVPSGIVSSLDFRMRIAADRDVGFIGSMTDGGQAGVRAAGEGKRPTAPSCPDL